MIAPQLYPLPFPSSHPMVPTDFLVELQVCRVDQGCLPRREEYPELLNLHVYAYMCMQVAVH